MEVTGTDCVEAIASTITDYEEAVVEKAASRNDMDYIITRNIKDYQNGSVKVILPDYFISLMEED